MPFRPLQDPQWVDRHLEAWINVAGPMLGLPKAVAPLLSGAGAAAREDRHGKGRDEAQDRDPKGGGAEGVGMAANGALSRSMQLPHAGAAAAAAAAVGRRPLQGR